MVLGVVCSILHHCLPFPLGDLDDSSLDMEICYDFCTAMFVIVKVDLVLRGGEFASVFL